MLAALVTTMVFAVTFAATVAGQAGAAPKKAASRPIPKTADGHPDLQGLWNSIDAFLTPLERPSKLAKENVSDEELSEVLRQEAQKKIDGALSVGVGSYGREWYEYKEGNISGQLSLVAEPPDGRIPPLTPSGREKADYIRAHATDSYEFLDPGDRCVTRGILGMMLPTFYNNGKQIVQAPGYVALMSEMIHDVRVIPTDVLRGIRLQSESLTMTERFTMVDGDTLMYRATIDDPKIYTRPWTIEYPFKRDNEYRMFEYACHEGNHAVEGILRGARAQEKRAK
jgi:hypothetical protein